MATFWRLNFWVFLPIYQENPMNTITRSATHSAVSLETLRPAPLSESAVAQEVLRDRHPNRNPIRHLLIGSPEVVQSTIYQLHTLRYAEVGLWSPAIAPSSSELVLTLNPGEVMRILLRYVAIENSV
jgi:hypothetical protein